MWYRIGEALWVACDILLVFVRPRCISLFGADSMQALLAGADALLLCLGDETSLNSGPFLGPTVIANKVTESKYRIDMAALPVHTSAFEACFND